jgi:hypothetical protein
MKYTFSKQGQLISYALMGLGTLLAIIGCITTHEGLPERLWANLMVDNFYFLAISLFAVFFMALQYAAQSGWWVMVKRVAEAISTFLWIPAGIMIIIILIEAFGGHSHIYHHWMQHGITDSNDVNYDKIIAEKDWYLNIPFFVLRALIYVGGWVFAGFLFRKYSKLQDETGELSYHKKSFKLAVIFLPFFAVTSVTAAWDWIMSIDAHWYSTMFGWYIFGGLWASGTAMMLLFSIHLKRKGYFPAVNDNHFHELGRMLFATSFLWTYLWFCQFMLIWYSNIPEEVAYYQARFHSYQLPFFGMLLFNFVAPMLVLMSRDSKRALRFTATIAVMVLVGHWINTFCLIMPGTVGSHWHIGALEIGFYLIYLGGFLFVVRKSLEKTRVVVAHDPYLVESEHFQM